MLNLDSKESEMGRSDRNPPKNSHRLWKDYRPYFYTLRSPLLSKWKVWFVDWHSLRSFEVELTVDVCRLDWCEPDNVPKVDAPWHWKICWTNNFWTRKRSANPSTLHQNCWNHKRCTLPHCFTFRQLSFSTCLFYSYRILWAESRDMLSSSCNHLWATWCNMTCLTWQGADRQWLGLRRGCNAKPRWGAGGASVPKGWPMPVDQELSRDIYKNCIDTSQHIDFNYDYLNAIHGVYL